MTRFDAYDPSFLDDPYPVFDELRRRSPVFFDADWDLTFFARHADVDRILRDRRFGRDYRHVLGPHDVDPALRDRIYPPQYPNWTRYVREDSFIDLEPPRHTRIRKLVNHAFTRRESETYRPVIQELADRLLDRLLEQRRVELIADYATPIPVAMIAELMAIPGEDRDRLVAWSHAIVKLFDRNATPTEAEAAEQAVSDFAAYLRDVLAERTAHPADDLVSALIQAESDGQRLTEDELIATCMLVLNAGHEATVHAIGNGLMALHDHPAGLRQLGRSPVIAGSATDELLRFDSPLQMFERWVLEDVEWEGHRLARGSKVGLLFGSANRDPAAFADPDLLDLERRPNPHLAFGKGTHYCVGAPLAKVELEVAFASFARRVAGFRIVEPPPRIPSLVFRGVEHLPVELEPA